MLYRVDKSAVKQKRLRLGTLACNLSVSMRPSSLNESGVDGVSYHIISQWKEKIYRRDFAVSVPHKAAHLKLF